MEKNSRTPQIIILLLVILFVLVYFIPIDFPQNVSVKGKLFPVKEWMLVKGTDGRLMSSLSNNKRGINENYSVTQFERGDAIRFKISERIKSGANVAINDTIGMIYSNESEKELIDLRSELAVESALLQVNLSTEKEAVVKSEEQRVEYAKKQLEEQEKLFRRQKALYEKNLISEEEFEVAKGAVDLFRINVDIANERLKTVTTGAKEEEIELVKSKIDGLKNQIDVLEQKFSDFIIQSPIDGIVQRIFSSDTILVISDTTEFIGVFPLDIRNMNITQIEQKITVDNPFNSDYMQGTVLSIDRTIQSAGQDQYYFVTTVFEGNNNNNFLPGMIVEGTIECGAEPLKNRINEFFISLIR